MLSATILVLAVFGSIALAFLFGYEVGVSRTRKYIEQMERVHWDEEGFSNAGWHD